MFRRFSLLFLLVLILPGCGTFRGARLYAPGWFGMEPIAAGVYADRAMPSPLRAELRQRVSEAKARTEAFFDGLVSSPEIFACSSEACFRSFGGSNALALAFGESKILLSPRGITTPVISHEWAHAELHSRVGGMLAMRRVPRWVDDGIAVVVSAEPSHSEAVWERIVAEKVPYPSLQELASSGDWRRAVARYGDLDCSLGRPGRLSVTYATAGQEVRTWCRTAGRGGLAEIMTALRRGENFAAAYQRLGER